MVDEGIEDLRTAGFGAFLAVVVADGLELAVFVLELEVVPILATHEYPGVAVLQLKVVQPLEDLGEGLALLEVETPVIPGGRLARTASNGADQAFIGIAHAPTGADRQRRVELPLDLADVERNSLRLGTAAQRNRSGQRLWREDGAHYCFCHASSPVSDRRPHPTAALEER